MTRSLPGRSSGAAMMMALLLTAILAVIAVQVSGTVQFNLQKASNRSQLEQAYWHALTAEKLVQQQLNEALEADEQFDLTQRWAKPRQQFAVERGAVEFSIKDDQHCYNLNALAKLSSDDSGEQLQTLEVRQLEHILGQQGYSENQRDRFIQAALDWLDNDVNTSGQQGAEDLYYTAQSPSYFSGNELIWRLSELNLIANPLDQQLAKLSTLICALPTTSLHININTLPASKSELLAAMLLNQADHKRIEQLLQQRPSKGFDSPQTLWQQLAIVEAEDSDELSQILSPSSEFFHAQIKVTVGSIEQQWTSWFHLRNGEFRLYSRAYGGRL